MCRLRELHTLKGHVENVVRLKGLDIDTIQQSYTVWELDCGASQLILEESIVMTDPQLLVSVLLLIYRSNWYHPQLLLWLSSTLLVANYFTCTTKAGFGKKINSALFSSCRQNNGANTVQLQAGLGQFLNCWVWTISELNRYCIFVSERIRHNWDEAYMNFALVIYKRSHLYN